MNLPYFLGRRLAHESTQATGNPVAVRVATLSVALGMAVMLIALGVIYGFKREISEKLSGLGAHLQISSTQGVNSLESAPLSSDSEWVDSLRQLSSVVQMHRYALKGGILKNGNVMQGVALKGFGTDFDTMFFHRSLVEGQLPRVADSSRRRDVLISQKTAQTASLGVGDKFEMIFIQQPPRRDRYQVCGIYNSGFEEMDKVLLMTDIRNVQRLNNWDPDQVTGFELYGSDLRQLDSLTRDVQHFLEGSSVIYEGGVMLTNLRQKNVMVFEWLDTHDLNGAIIIVIMLIVSIFNMIAALLIILLEKSRFIGVMKSLGMSDRDLQRVFLYRSGYIILRGMIWGNVVGILLCYLQQTTGVLKLDATGYFLSTVPVAMNWSVIAALNVGVFLILIACQMIPTHLIAKISPETNLRTE